jgi:hypothetical protein
VAICVRCGMPALSGSNFCDTHQREFDGEEVVYTRARRAAASGGSDSAGLQDVEEREQLEAYFGPSPKDIG